jgi:hypothetical protein
MPKRDAAIVVTVVVVLAVIAFLFLSPAISILLELNPPSNAI